MFYIDSFSKTLSASLRCGYISALTDYIEPSLDLKIATGFVGGDLAAAVMLSALSDSGCHKHMNAPYHRLALMQSKKRYINVLVWCDKAQIIESSQNHYGIV